MQILPPLPREERERAGLIEVHVGRLWAGPLVEVLEAGAVLERVDRFPLPPAYEVAYRRRQAGGCTTHEIATVDDRDVAELVAEQVLTIERPTEVPRPRIRYLLTGFAFRGEGVSTAAQVRNLRTRTGETL